MGKSAPSPPPVPDPTELINAQANANRITQFTPYGNLLFGSVGDQGQFVQGAVPEDGQAATFTQETPFQAQMRAATEGTGLGLGNLAFNRVTGRQVAFSRHKTLTRLLACLHFKARSAPPRQCRQASTLKV